ncbi:ABC transporter permease [Microbacterium kribbense]|uniref:ABC transporter permease n=1 Tax=Microbacterium kribbense TaxID=433645 RepID=A0ABP7G5Y5_9MICO
MNGLLKTPAGLIGAQLIALVVIILLWWGAAIAAVLPPAVLPTPYAVGRAFAELVTDSVYWAAIGNTLIGALQGFVAAIIVGIPVGMLTGRSRFAEESGRFLVEFGRSFPTIALLPVLVLILGATTPMKAVVVFTATLFPLIIQVQHGARRIEPSITETIQAYRIPPMLRVVKVVLPTAAPFIATGIKLAATVSVLVSLGVEVLGGVPGVGRQLTMAQQDGAPDFAFAYIFTAGVLGFGVNAIVGLLRDKLVRWDTADTEE